MAGGQQFSNGKANSCRDLFTGASAKVLKRHRTLPGRTDQPDILKSIFFEGYGNPGLGAEETMQITINLLSQGT